MLLVTVADDAPDRHHLDCLCQPHHKEIVRFVMRHWLLMWTCILFFGLNDLAVFTDAIDVKPRYVRCSFPEWRRMSSVVAQA